MPPIPPGTTARYLAIQPIAGLLAILLPGLGHWYLGYARRARLIAAGVLGMFAAGLFVGGIDAVDRREDPPWFIGQALVGPVAFAVDWVHQNHFKVRAGNPPLRSAYPNETRDPATGRPVAIHLDPQGVPTATISGSGGSQTIKPARPPNVKSLSRMNELGTLFGTIAGMMNLICIIDAAFSRRREQEDPA